MSVTPVLILAMGNQLQFQLDVAIGREKKGAQGGMFFLLIVILQFESHGPIFQH